jgi:hypothetical protein
MAIIPVVPGQTLDRRFSIPSRKSTNSVLQLNDISPSQSNTQEEPKDPLPTTTDRGAGSDDIVNNMAKLNVTSNSQLKSTDVDLIRRHDSQTNEVDEFHDAIS